LGIAFGSPQPAALGSIMKIPLLIFSLLCSLIVEAQNVKTAIELTPDEQRDGWIEAYCRENGIAPAPLAIGMSEHEVLAYLGPPTDRSNDWLTWYHNPTGRHVAPYVYVKLCEGHVCELRAGRR
jgi:hypothetical protein